MNYFNFSFFFFFSRKVAITPASGFVTSLSAIAIGFTGAVICNLGSQIKNHLGFDDSFDTFGVHGLGGYFGCIMTGIFADNYVYTLDQSSPVVLPSGGWINHNYRQIGIQIAAASAGAAYSFVVTVVILLIMDRIPGLRLRSDYDDEMVGSDLSHLGEKAHNFFGKMDFLFFLPFYCIVNVKFSPFFFFFFFFNHRNFMK